MTEKKDIMDSILSDADDTLADRSNDLDFLIYQCGDGVQSQDAGLPDTNEQKSIKVSKGNVSVEIWEGRAKIKVKVSPGTDTGISMEKIATIAVDAILEALKKETP